MIQFTQFTAKLASAALAVVSLANPLSVKSQSSVALSDHSLKHAMVVAADVDETADVAPVEPVQVNVVADDADTTAKNEAKNDVKWTTVRTITAYSSTVDQCDDTPFITANGTHVRDGIVAANWLPFNTKVRIPELFGDKVFVVTDRMNVRHNTKMDIWMETREAAIKFGVRQATIEVLK